MDNTESDADGTLKKQTTQTTGGLRKVSMSAPMPNQSLQDIKLKGILDPITRVVEGRERSEVMALAIGASISAIVVKSVDGLTEELFSWASKTSVLGPVYNELQLNIFGATINIPRMVGIFVYILLSLGILAFLAFGILSPLLSRSDSNSNKNREKDNKNK